MFSDLWAQKKILKLWQVTQDSRLCPAEFLWEFFKSISLLFLQKLEKYTLEPFLGQLCSVTECSWCFQVFLSKLLLVFSYFLTLPCYWGKNSVSGDDWIDVLFFITERICFYCEGKVFSQNENSWIFSTILEGDNLYVSNSTFISPIYTFPWRETLMFTRQFKVQIRKSNLIILFIKEKMPTFAGNKHPSVHFFLYGPRLFLLWTEKVRVRSVGNGHQSGYSRTDTTQ